MQRIFIIGKTIATAALILVGLAIHVHAQTSPDVIGELEPEALVQVETLELEPTVVKSGDLITQVYRLRFLDLFGEGKEIIILEDRMVPENLPVNPFEGVSLTVRKSRIGDEHIWDFVFGFRLIAPEKSDYVLPAFSFFYLVRDLGEDVEDAEIRQVDGGGGIVRYVTTMTGTPTLDIRDTIELGNFSAQATMFNAIAWTIAPLPLFIWLFILFRSVRRASSASKAQLNEADELKSLEDQIAIPPSIWQARKNLLRELKMLEAFQHSDNDDALRGLERALVITGREYLQAELLESHIGDTPRDLQRHVNGLKDDLRKEALGTLADRVVSYQDGLEHGSQHAINDQVAEAKELQQALMFLRPHVRLWMQFKKLFGS